MCGNAVSRPVRNRRTSDRLSLFLFWVLKAFLNILRIQSLYLRSVFAFSFCSFAFSCSFSFSFVCFALCDAVEGTRRAGAGRRSPPRLGRGGASGRRHSCTQGTDHSCWRSRHQRLVGGAAVGLVGGAGRRIVPLRPADHVGHAPLPRSRLLHRQRLQQSKCVCVCGCACAVVCVCVCGCVRVRLCACAV